MESKLGHSDKKATLFCGKMNQRTVWCNLTSEEDLALERRENCFATKSPRRLEGLQRPLPARLATRWRIVIGPKLNLADFPILDNQPSKKRLELCKQGMKNRFVDNSEFWISRKRQTLLHPFSGHARVSRVQREANRISLPTPFLVHDDSFTPFFCEATVQIFY